jgi:hypothetical protein
MARHGEGSEVLSRVGLLFIRLHVMTSEPLNKITMFSTLSDDTLGYCTQDFLAAQVDVTCDSQSVHSLLAATAATASQLLLVKCDHTPGSQFTTMHDM